MLSEYLCSVYKPLFLIAHFYRKQGNWYEISCMWCLCFAKILSLMMPQKVILKITIAKLLMEVTFLRIFELLINIKIRDIKRSKRKVFYKWCIKRMSYKTFITFMNYSYYWSIRFRVVRIIQDHVKCSSF